MANIALIIAGGSGSRMRQDIPKQFLTVNEKPVIIYTLEAFERHPLVQAIAVVCLAGWEQVLLGLRKAIQHNKTPVHRSRWEERAGVDHERRICA